MTRQLPVKSGLAGLILSAVALAIAHPYAAQARRPEVWAIVIGVENYVDPGIADARGSIGQANQVFSWLRSVADWDRSHLLLLTDLGANDPGKPEAPAPNIRPSRANLTWAFDVWLKAKARPDDLILVYYAGRAVGLARDPGAEGVPRPDYLLMPVDGLINGAAQTGWSLDRALDPYSRQGKFQVVCWLATTPQPAGGQAAPGASGLDWLRRLTRWPGATAWLASDRPRPRPAASNEEPAALFTRALVEGLGDSDRKPNLAGCLKSLQQNPALKLQGFEALGGVPASLTLRRDRFGLPQPRVAPEMVLQVGHADRVNDLSASADGRLLVTSSMDSTARVWSVDQRALNRVLTGQMVGVTALAYSDDDRFVITGGGRGQVLVYNAESDLAVRPIPRQPHDRGAETARIVRIAMLPDAEHFVSVDSRGDSYRWDLGVALLTPEPWLPPGTCREVVCGGGRDNGLVAALGVDGSTRFFKPDGTPEPALAAGPAGEATAIAVATDGRTVAVGLADGKVALHRSGSDGWVEHQAVSGPIRRLTLCGPRRLAIGHDGGVELLALDDALQPGERLTLIDRPVERMVATAAGLRLAVCTANVGAVRAWRLGDDRPLAPRLMLEAGDARAFALDFIGNGDTLAAGGFDGAVQFWNLEDDAFPDNATPFWHVAPSRGQVSQLASSPGREALAVRAADAVYLWSLTARTCRRITGQWTSAAFLSERALALTVAADAPEHAGRLVRLDADTFAVDARHFARRADGYEIPDETAFTRATVSADRTRVAACADGAQVPLVCVWDAASGRLLHWIEAIDDPVVALAFSDDARTLALGLDAPEAQLWELGEPGPIEQPRATVRDPDGQAVTCIQIAPGADRRLLTGHRDGRVLLWTGIDGGGEPAERVVVRNLFAGAVNALALAGDGRTLAAAGDGNTIWLGQVGPTPGRLPDLSGRPHHFEQVNALTFWAEAGLLVSGSDDASVKFWDLETRKLWGTLALAPRRDRVAAPAAVVDQDWALFTPDGVFDASAEGRDLVRFRAGDGVRPMEQFEGTRFHFELASLLRAGSNPPPADPRDEPIALAIDPPARRDPKAPEVSLTVTVGAEGGAARPDVTRVTDVRLYHNGVPVPTRPAAGPDAQPGQFRADVRLLNGVNRFYAMASRDGAHDSRSADVELKFDGPSDPSQVHVIALGIGEGYQRRKLKYPERDALRISQVLQQRGIELEGQPGIRKVLLNDDVNTASIQSAFGEVARRVRGRPQDTVVVFLAGHTGVFDDQRFCLLLPRFPFPEQEPITVAARDVTPLEPGARLLPEHILPYTSVMVNLTRLEALNRLVIVDACQSEAILSDPQVTAIRKWMEVGSTKARTSYLLAARRGEPALEVDPLRHGLFTYALLRGLNALDPAQPEPKELADLQAPPNADFDGDGELSTGELDAYAKQVVPQLSARFATLVANRREALPPAQRTGPPPEQLDQAVRLQSASVSFPLVPLR